MIRQKLSDKKIWPFPTSADGKDSGWEERAQIAKKEKYQLWQSSKPSEVGQTWKLINGKFYELKRPALFGMNGNYRFLSKA